MKSNLVHTLFRVRKYGLMDLEKFKDVLSPSDYRRCERSNKNTWYSLTQGVFTSFIFQVLLCDVQSHYSPLRFIDCIRQFKISNHIRQVYTVNVNLFMQHSDFILKQSSSESEISNVMVTSMPIPCSRFQHMAGCIVH